MKKQTSQNITIALIGNKIDLQDKREIESTEAERFAEEHGLLFMETSAKTGEHVSDVFTNIGMH